MTSSNYICVIADDLTGANDTSLQFFLQGCKTQVAFGEELSIDESLNTEVFALSTETRNANKTTSVERIKAVCEKIIKEHGFEYIYKKMDSVLRGNFGLEVLTLIEELNLDAAVIFPAFPNEGRTTVGGFHLLKGIPVQRTDVSRDPACPVSESNILSLVKSQIGEDKKDLVGLIAIDTIMKGAGPILIELNELIHSGKKIIVADAVMPVDLEQIALAVTKSSFNILPCGSAGAAQKISKIWRPDYNENKFSKYDLPKLPKLIVSGSATELTANQIKTLQDNEQNLDIKFIPIKPENIFNNDFEVLASEIKNNLVENTTVVVHSASLMENTDAITELLFEYEISRDDFISKICEYLSAITRSVLAEKQAILVTVGGETSYKCCRALGSKNLQILDRVVPAIPLGVDNKGQYIVTKSGNLGTPNTLIDILKYFE